MCKCSTYSHRGHSRCHSLLLWRGQKQRNMLTITSAPLDLITYLYPHFLSLPFVYKFVSCSITEIPLYFLLICKFTLHITSIYHTVIWLNIYNVRPLKLFSLFNLILSFLVTSNYWLYHQDEYLYNQLLSLNNSTPQFKNVCNDQVFRNLPEHIP